MVEQVQFRGLIRIFGPDAADLLDRILTVSPSLLNPGEATQAALLQPQGKIQFCGIVFRQCEEEFWFDIAKFALTDLRSRLMMYKLRSNLQIEDHSKRLFLFWSTKDDSECDDKALFCYDDPRHQNLGRYFVVPNSSSVKSNGSGFKFDQARVACICPEFGRDFGSTQIFPSDANMDLSGGVDLHKGCFVGQEVVSRIYRRGGVRKRFCHVSCRSEKELQIEDKLTMGEQEIGKLTTVFGMNGLALLRVDRLEDVLTKPSPLCLNGDISRAVEITLPSE